MSLPSVSSSWVTSASSLWRTYRTPPSPPNTGGPLPRRSYFDDFGEMNATIDLYALGMVLYLVYNGGQGPFAESQEGAEARRLKGEALPPPAYADYEMAAIILKAAAFRPEDRWQSPEAMGQALVSYMQRNPVNDSVIAAPIVTAPHPGRRGRRPGRPGRGGPAGA